MNLLVFDFAIIGEGSAVHLTSEYRTHDYINANEIKVIHGKKRFLTSFILIL